MIKSVAGIDPGYSGGIAVFEVDNKKISSVWLYDIPVLKIDRKKEIDTHSFINLIKKHNIQEIAIERAQVLPKQGIVSSGNYMKLYGILIGIITALGIKYHEVRPQEWKKKMLVGKKKELSIQRCEEILPLSFKRKRDHNVCDAALIALYFLESTKEVILCS